MSLQASIMRYPISKVLINIVSAVINIVIGLGLGLVMLELTLRLDPSLAPKGIGPVAPLDPPLTISSYDVRYTDGDSIWWSPELVKPISPQENRTEVHVDFETDEFGFPNQSPIPQTVDMVVLGRSYSLGAETTIAWPKLVSQQTGWKVLNLAQIGSGTDVKLNFLRQYGLKRHPRWIVVEVLPLMDIFGYQHADPLLIQQIPIFLMQGMLHQLHITGSESNTLSQRILPTQIYPLFVHINAQTFHVTFSIHELRTLTTSISQVTSLSQWQLFKDDLQLLLREAHDHSACVALLYAQSKTGTYLPMLTEADGLKPMLQTLGQEGKDQESTLATLQGNAEAMRALIETLAQQNSLVFIDPTDKLRAALAAGNDPFLAYDSHLNPAGHVIVAQQVIESLSKASCN